MIRVTLPPDTPVEVSSLLTGPGLQAVRYGDHLVVSPAAFLRLSMGESVEALIAPDPLDFGPWPDSAPGTRPRSPRRP